jgi:hypothetical protein
MFAGWLAIVVTVEMAIFLWWCSFVNASTSDVMTLWSLLLILAAAVGKHGNSPYYGNE